MTPYFANSQQQAKLVEAAGLWMRTPFRAHMSVRGFGVDCVQLAGQIMLHSGAVENYDFGDYHLDWSAYQDHSIIIDYLDRIGWVKESPAMVGDVACFRIGRSAGHCGVMLDADRFVHVLVRGRVCVSQLSDPTWAKRLVALYRRMIP